MHQELCIRLLADLSGLLTDWNRIAEREDPWGALPWAERTDGIIGLMTGLIRSALCQPDDPRERDALLFAAIAHGQVRARQDFRSEDIIHEYRILVRSLWAHLRNRLSDEEAAPAMRALDVAVTVAKDGTLWGYDEPDASDEQITRAVERLAARWPRGE